MADKKKSKDGKTSNKKASDQTIVFLQKPQIPRYECLLEGGPSEEPEARQRLRDDDLAIPGFGEFRKYKKVNETRIITPYRPEPAKKKEIKVGTRILPAIEIENAETFLLENIRGIRVESLESLVQMIKIYPDVGFVTMNRPHMDLLNDYRPYSYEICNYNNKDPMNYVTISPNGLLEVYKGDADFMELDGLLEEYRIYRALQEIPLFSYLIIWKAFMVWFKKIRRRKFEDAKAKIEAFFAEKYKVSKKKQSFKKSIVSSY